MKKFLILSFIFFTLSATGCAQTKSPTNSSVAQTNKESIDGSSIDPKKAREFSDSVVRAFIEDREKDLREKMEQAFRNYYSEKEMKVVLEKMYSAYGKPLEVEFKKDEAGYKFMTLAKESQCVNFGIRFKPQNKTKSKNFYLRRLCRTEIL